MKNNIIQHLFRIKNTENWFFWLSSLAILWITFQLNTLLFHVIVELLSSFIGLQIFLTMWHNKRFISGTFFLFLGCSYLWISLLGIAHMLTMRGMSFFSLEYSQTTLHLWVYTRLFEALALFLASIRFHFVLTKNQVFLVTGSIAATIFWFASNFQYPILIDQGGLTQTKINLEYLAITIFALALVNFIKNKKHLSVTLFNNLAGALVIAIVAEYTFTLYNQYMDNTFVIGHFLRLFALALIYDIFVKKLIDKPYEMLEMKLISYEAIPNPTLILNSAGDILHANDAAANLIASERSQILQENVHQLFHDTSIAKKDCDICKAISQQRTDNIFDIHHPLTERFFLVTLAKIELEDEPLLLVQSMVDTSLKENIELELKHSENKYHTLVDNLPIGVFETNAAGECIYVNKEWQLQAGMNFESALGSGWQKALHQQDQSRIFKEWNSHVNESKPWDLEYRFIDANNNVRNIMGRAIAERNDLDEIKGYIGTTIDISQIKVYEKQLETLHQVVEQAPISIMITDLTGDIEYVNSGFEQITGYNRNEILGTNPRFLKSENTPISTHQKIWQSLLSGKTLNIDMQNKKKDGRLYWENSNYSVVKNENGIAYKYLSIKTDITEQIEDKKKLYQQANFDFLTGLPNRFRILKILENLLSNAKMNNDKLGILVINIDDFKRFNDTLGHLIGDQLLKIVAERLDEIKNTQDIVGRLGGDEFIIIQKNHKGNFAPDKIASAILSAFENPINVQGRTIILNLGIGIATYPDNGVDVSELLKNSDLALVAAKNIGSGKKIHFDQKMREETERHFALEEQLQNALSRNELYVVFQPQFDTYQTRISGIEALVRWNNAKFGMISPAEFIPIAEKTGLIVEIGYFIIEEVIKARLRWYRTLEPDTRIAINLSPRQFDDGKLVQKILSTLDKYNVPISSIELEITEGVFIDSDSLVIETLSTMHDIGLKLSLDDFGTGYSSLSYLRRFPFDILKVDQSFVRDMHDSQVDRQLVEATIAMAHALELTVVAEGVEQIDQLELLKSLKCDFVQGYLFCKPLKYNEMSLFIRDHKVSNPIS